jgi:hypothetical protein
LFTKWAQAPTKDKNFTAKVAKNAKKNPKTFALFAFFAVENFGSGFARLGGKA